MLASWDCSRLLALLHLDLGESKSSNGREKGQILHGRNWTELLLCVGKTRKKGGARPPVTLSLACPFLVVHCCGRNPTAAFHSVAAGACSYVGLGPRGQGRGGWELRVFFFVSWVREGRVFSTTAEKTDKALGFFLS